MTLQYRPDNDHLIYLGDVSGDPLAAACCCATETDNIRFDLCCDDVPFDERIEHPHFIVISPARDTALGSPTMVLYGTCCYQRVTDPASTIFPVNVVESLVTVSAAENCEGCNQTDGGLCDYCSSPCNDCDPPLRGYYTISFSGIEPIDHCSPTWLNGQTVYVVASEYECHWYGYIFDVLIQLNYYEPGGFWSIDIDWGEVGCENVGGIVYPSPGPCYPTGVYPINSDSGAGTCVVS